MGGSRTCLGFVLLAIMLAMDVARGASAQDLPFCRPGEAPQFRQGFAGLKAELGDTMGDPAECEHPDGADGDVLQRTTTGLAFYRRSSNVPMFTDGFRHWASTPAGLAYWEGDAVDPPEVAAVATPPVPPQRPVAVPAPTGASPPSVVVPGAVYRGGLGSETRDSLELRVSDDGLTVSGSYDIVSRTCEFSGAALTPPPSASNERGFSASFTSCSPYEGIRGIFQTAGTALGELVLAPPSNPRNNPLWVATRSR